MDGRPAREMMLRKQNTCSKAQEICKHFSETIEEKKSQQISSEQMQVTENEPHNTH